MKQFILSILVIIVVTVGVTLGQGLEADIKVRRPDFSGKWLYNHEESDPESRNPILAKIKVKIFVTIQQDWPNITLTYTSEPKMDELPFGTFHIYADGREDDLLADMNKRGFSGTVSWEDGKLVRRIFDRSKKLQSRYDIELVAYGKKLRFSDWHQDSLGRIFEGFDIYDRVQQ